MRRLIQKQKSIRCWCFAFSFLINIILLSSAMADTDSASKTVAKNHLENNFISMTADMQFEYARHCFSDKEYLRAAHEYNRFIYFFPEDERIEEALYLTGSAYYKADHFSEAIKSFQSVIEKYEGTEYFVQSHFMISKCYKAQNEYGLAATSLHNLIAMSDNLDVKDRAIYEISWLYFEKPWFEGSLENGKKYLLEISPENREKYKFEAIMERVDAAILNPKKTIPEKNPTLAGTLSVIPGLGYVYMGRYQDAFIAFILNGGLILASYEAFYYDNNALGGLIAFVGTGFYIGNIYGAKTSAHKYNRKQREQYIKKMKRELKVGFVPGIDNRSFMISFRYRF